MSNNITKIYTNTLKTQILGENWFNINKESIDKPIFEPRTFKLNKADMVCDENSESNSEIWQIDSNEVLEANGSLENLGLIVFYTDAGKNVQIVCNRQHKYPALKECNPICKSVSKDIKSSCYICSECYELEGRHFHIRPDNKNEEYQKKVLRTFLPSYFQLLNENNLYEINTEIEIQIQPNESNVIPNHLSIPILSKLPTFFMI
ncbi:hypothetical protein GLOIN_2v1474502 [Rhizophagus clarus]|uniref:Uncharacterized protein n=1 Tax=Rhizophagus clarus TaxID=94130 RepID=A0A8H3M6J8_9GLOM|nr:hypothetical protein GLOIN_2v1474502 [Rhizophagus clarus]